MCLAAAERQHVAAKQETPFGNRHRQSGLLGGHRQWAFWEGIDNGPSGPASTMGLLGGHRQSGLPGGYRQSGLPGGAELAKTANRNCPLSITSMAYMCTCVHEPQKQIEPADATVATATHANGAIGIRRLRLMFSNGAMVRWRHRQLVRPAPLQLRHGAQRPPWHSSRRVTACTVSHWLGSSGQHT